MSSGCGNTASSFGDTTPAAPPAYVLPEYLQRAINGTLTAEEKHRNYDTSLQSWWKEYASRKNNEEEEHVADSLLYDERCHLPRTAAAPIFVYPALEDEEEGAPAPPAPAAPLTGQV